MRPPGLEPYENQLWPSVGACGERGHLKKIYPLHLTAGPKSKQRSVSLVLSSNIASLAQLVPTGGFILENVARREKQRSIANHRQIYAAKNFTRVFRLTN